MRWSGRVGESEGCFPGRRAVLGCKAWVLGAEDGRGGKGSADVVFARLLAQRGRCWAGCCFPL